MKTSKSLIIVLLILISSQFTFAQQAHLPQRGQRGYVPPPKNMHRTNIELKDVQKELELIVPICVSEFALDDFEKEIFKQLLTQKIEKENAILSLSLIHI